MSVWDIVSQYVDQYHMLEPEDHIIIGLSGGADSICLAEYLCAQRESFHLSLHAVHVNHMLRGEDAIRDENFVRNYCQEKQLPLRVFKKDILQMAREEHLSSEEAGRIYRYACFDQVAEELGWKSGEKNYKIAVAHHKNDQAETMLFRLARGTGPEGLIGVRPIVEGERCILRPLLCIMKEEIISILDALGQEYVTDDTNFEDIAHRNMIRNQVIPILQEVNEGAVSHFASLAEQMLELQEYVAPKIDALFDRYVITEKKDNFYHCYIEETDFYACTSFEKKEVLRRMLYTVSEHKKDLTAFHVELLKKLMDKETGKRLDLPYQMIALREEHGISLLRKESLVWKERISSEQKNISQNTDEMSELMLDRSLLETGQKLFINIPYSIEYTGMELSLEAAGEYSSEKYREENIKNDCLQSFDYDKIKCNPCIRTRKSGDYLVIDENGNHKRLKRYLIDRKIPVDIRDCIPLLADGAHIMWVAGMRISEYYKVDAGTKRIMKVFLKRR